MGLRCLATEVNLYKCIFWGVDQVWPAPNPAAKVFDQLELAYRRALIDDITQRYYHNLCVPAGTVKCVDHWLQQVYFRHATYAHEICRKARVSRRTIAKQMKSFKTIRSDELGTSEGDICIGHVFVVYAAGDDIIYAGYTSRRSRLAEDAQVARKQWSPMVGSACNFHFCWASVLSVGRYFEIAPVLVQKGVVSAIMLLFTVKADPGHLVV
jgi:hypothetical protein